MGLDSEDLKKVPKGISVKECYKRIFDWHKKYGKIRAAKKQLGDEVYVRAYLALVDELPSPSKATQGDMDFVFGQVISMLVEWSYHEQDEHGIKIAAYAHFALDKQYAKGFQDEEFKKSMKTSKLSTRFDKWR